MARKSGGKINSGAFSNWVGGQTVTHRKTGAKGKMLTFKGFPPSKAQVAWENGTTTWISTKLIR